MTLLEIIGMICPDNFQKNFRGHKSFLWGHWYSCFGLLVTPAQGCARFAEILLVHTYQFFFSQKVLGLVPSFHAQILTSTSSELELKLENQIMFLVAWKSSLLLRKWKTWKFQQNKHTPGFQSQGFGRFGKFWLFCKEHVSNVSIVILLSGLHELVQKSWNKFIPGGLPQLCTSESFWST